MWHDPGFRVYFRIDYVILCLRKRNVTCFGSASRTSILTFFDVDKQMCHIF